MESVGRGYFPENKEVERVLSIDPARSRAEPQLKMSFTVFRAWETYLLHSKVAFL